MLEIEADKSSFGFSLRQAVGYSQLVCRIVSPIGFSTVCLVVCFIVCSSGGTQTRSNVFMSKLCDVRSQYFTQQLREVKYIVENTLFLTENYSVSSRIKSTRYLLDFNDPLTSYRIISERIAKSNTNSVKPYPGQTAFDSKVPSTTTIRTVLNITPKAFHVESKIVHPPPPHLHTDLCVCVCVCVCVCANFNNLFFPVRPRRISQGWTMKN